MVGKTKRRFAHPTWLPGSQEAVAFELQKCQLLLQQKDLELQYHKK